MKSLRQKEEQLVRYLNHIASKSALTRLYTVFLARSIVWLLLVVVFIFWIYETRNIVSSNTLLPAIIMFLWTLFLPSVVWGISTVIKHTVRTKRPFDVLKDFTPLFHFGSLAFPSGHTTFMVALSVVSFDVFGYMTGAFFLCISLLSAVSRIAAGVHWPRDIIGSLVLVTLFYSSIFLFF